ncbi:MAG: PhoH family protein [Candidatus Aureabacteria bacterium]|nr:PhoH family protein [Candidatus Auribacterota bacterium]
MKIFVLDTNVLLHNAGALQSFADNIVVLPMSVIEELDKFKSQNNELGRNARSVIRLLDRLRVKGSLQQGVPTETGGIIKIVSDSPDIKTPVLDGNVIDNRIIRVAYSIKKNNSDKKIIFVSKDINARIKSDALGIDTRDFEKQRIDYDKRYEGIKEVKVDFKKMAELLDKGITDSEEYSLTPNEFVIFREESNEENTLLCKNVITDNKLVAIRDYKKEVFGITARSLEQRAALEILLDPNIHLVTLTGEAGTGKTLLALAAGLELTLKNKMFTKILVSRPIMPLGKDIGFLPGSKEEKLGHWMVPIYDNLEYLFAQSSMEVKSKVDHLFKSGIMVLEALTYIRGRSIPKQYVIIDEAQNLTPHEIKTIISRAGMGTKMVLTGDPDQIDNPYLDASSNGLSYCIEHLKKEKLHGHVRFKKSERSPLASIAANLL